MLTFFKMSALLYISKQTQNILLLIDCEKGNKNVILLHISVLIVD